MSLYIFKRVGGIEPPSLAWKAKVLPLNYTRIVRPVGTAMRFYHIDWGDDGRT